MLLRGVLLRVVVDNKKPQPELGLGWGALARHEASDVSRVSLFWWLEVRGTSANTWEAGQVPLKKARSRHCLWPAPHLHQQSHGQRIAATCAKLQCPAFRSGNYHEAATIAAMPV
jgi:hypothetical protein